MKFTKKVRERFALTVGTATGLFLALTYRDFFEQIINMLFDPGDGVFGRFLYIAMATVVVVLLNIGVQKWVVKK